MLRDVIAPDEPGHVRLARRGRFIVCEPHESDGDYREFVKRREALHLFAASTHAPAILVDCRKGDVAVPPEVFSAVSHWPRRLAPLTWSVAMLLPDPRSRSDVATARSLATLLSCMGHRTGLFGDYPAAAAWLNGQFRLAHRPVH